MSTDRDDVYMYRLSPAGDAILINRTLAIIGENNGPFVVRVTDRDYEYDPSGLKQTLVFDGRYGSIKEAESERDRQITLSLDEGFVPNRIAGTPY